MNPTDSSGGYGGGSQPGAGGYNLPPPQGGGYGPPQGGGYGPPPQAPGPFDKVKAFVATTPGKIVAAFGMLTLLGMCGTVCGAAKSARRASPDANGVKVNEAEKNCRDHYNDETKYSNCAAACGEGAKWACDVAETLKAKLKEEAKTKADDAVAARERAAVSEVARARQPVAAVAAREPVADTTAAPEPASLSGKRETFPGIVQKFIDMNELQQDAYAPTFKGVVLSGSGQVTEVEKCGFLDDSEKWGDDCVKLVLDSGIPRVALYYGEKDKATVAARTKGSRVTFSNCVANSIKNWGFWSTATCDMP